MKAPIIHSIILGAAILNAPAAVLSYSWTDFGGNSSLPIPDANATGVSDTRSILAEALEILMVTVFFETVAEFNGDLYVTVQHNSGFSVLLNRPGRSAENSFGYSDQGFNVAFRDNAANGDVHTYRQTVTLSEGSPLTGIWQPDARTADPATSLTSSPRTAPLSSFQGQSVAGEWTLFAADVSPGGQAQILSWGVEIVIVPEPHETALATALSLFGLAFLKKRTCRA